MRYQIKLLGMVLAVSLFLPMTAFALKAHYLQTCNECHRSTASPRKMANLCIPCHTSTDNGAFTQAKGSDALDHHPDNPPDPSVTLGGDGDQTSHFWGGTSSSQLEAGTAPPPTTFYSSRYSISTNLVTCSICHNPHGEAGTQLLRAPKDNDLICQQCHIYFYVDNPQAQMTHPIGNYAAAYDAAPTPKKYKLTGDIPNNASQGITLVNGNISCSTCHAPHFSDSDSSTADGLLNVNNLNPGDGHLLKADGPFQVNKSALCQTCHTYQEHGKVGNNAAGSGAGDVQIGCLVCHSGHSYDVTEPNFFVLRKTVNSGVAGYGSKTDLLYPTYPLPPASFAAYCIKCHGAVGTYTLRPHSLPADNDCKICHAHNGTAYSFAQGSTGTACSSCHGAPPRTNTAADRADNTVPDTGYAVGQNGTSYLTDDSGNTWKDETRTPHKRHAGALESDKVPVDYAFGSGSVLSACLPCHNDKEDAVSPPSATHDKTISNLSFQDVYFDSFSSYGSVLVPSYRVSTPNQWTCSNVYCHSNGGKRRADGLAKTSTEFTVTPINRTPPWLNGSDNTTNVGTIIGQTSPTHECAFCHGRTQATMAGGAKNNSQTHNIHLAKFGDNHTSCYLCHSTTVDGTGIIPASARDVRLGGDHVNGAVEVDFTDSAVGSHSSFGTELASGTYTPGASGTCVVYCHSNGKGSTVQTPDWDDATTGDCGDCHGTTAGALSISHTKHLAIASITCNSCHFTVAGDATLGTHTGHVDGAFTFSQTSCNTCHGYDAGETLPAWGTIPANDGDPGKRDDYCITCHTGTNVTPILASGGIRVGAPAKRNNLTTGHGKPSGPYPFPPTGANNAANRTCTECHVSSGDGHFDGDDLDKRLILGSNGFPLAYATVTEKNNYCGACHGVAPGHTPAATKTGIITHVTTACVSCHDPHGDPAVTPNVFMVRSASTGNYSGTVDFKLRSGANSYDEVDAANADDLCATCHTYNLGVLSDHNTKTNQGIAHHEGETCMTAICHKGHTETGGAFIAGASACNGCHGNPPLPGDARHTDAEIGAHEVHAQSVIHDKDQPEHDATDCDICHPGASGYTYTPSGLHGSGNLALGMAGGTTGCSSACHASNGTDGFWTDTANVLTPTLTGNGLACNACHYYAATPVAGNNLSDVHDEHFTKNKDCTACHGNMLGDYNSGLAHVGPLTHINDYVDLDTVDDDGALYTDRAIATQDEAGFDEGGGIRDVNRSGMTYTDNNTCSGGIGLGCHATGTPDWDLTIPANGCIQCHTDTTTTTLNPTSGLHNMSTPGVQKHDNSITGGCTACHADLSTVQTTHINGTWQADQANNTQSRFLTRSGLVYNDTAGPNQGSCFDAGATGAGSLDFVTINCHRDNGVWKRLWSTDADDAGTTPGSPRCKVCHGQYTTLNSNQGGGWNENTSHYLTDGGRASIRGESHNSLGGDVNACENCHIFPSLARHENGTLTMNDAPAAGDTDIDDSTTWVRCAICHADNDPLTPGTFTFTKSTAFTIERFDGGSDPISQCNSCHGAGGGGRYWPVAANGGPDSDNHIGRHEIHMARLALKVYGESVATLLTNTAQTSEIKQKNLCEYCHAAPVGAAGHHQQALPAEVAITNLWNKAVDTGATYSSNQHGTGGNDTCAGVNCHNNKLTVGYGWYDSATGSCIVCHTVGGTNDFPNNNIHPNSGLHNITPTVSGVRHDDSFSTSGNCASCHTGIASAIVGGTHINGAASADGPTNTREERGLFAAYTEAAINSSTCAGSGVDNTANCHADGGTWNRRWSTTASASNGIDECLNCHGTFAGWRWSDPPPAGTTDHIDPSALNVGDVMGVALKHPDCQICHGWGKPGYDTAWHNKTIGATPGHGDGRITMNGPDDVPGPGAGAKYDDATGGCAGACHSATWVMSDSGLTANYGDYGGGSCDTCHGVVGTGQFWPDGSGGSPSYADDNVNSAARHTTHLTAIAQYKWSLSLTALKADSTKQKEACAFCHTTPGESGHNDNLTPATIVAAGAFQKFTGGGNSGPDADSGAYSGGTTRSCSNLVCHNLVATPTAANDSWEGTTAANCTTLCHGPNTTATAREGHQKHVVTKGYACVQCHPANTGLYGHINGTVNILFGAGSMEQTYGSGTAASYVKGSVAYNRNPVTSSTCLNVYCHVDKETPAWSNAIAATGCVNCHTAGGAGNNPTSGLHAMTANNVTRHDSTLRNGCTECHASLTSDPASHIDGAWLADGPTNQTVGGQPRFLTGTRTALSYSEGAPNSSTCWDDGVINVTTGLDYNGGAAPGCHRDNGAWKRLWSTAANADMSILANQDPGLPVCDVCHGQYASSAGWREGSVHYRSGNNAAEAKGSSHNKTGGNANKCKDCHAYYPGGVSNHENTVLNFSGTGVATQPNYALTAGTSGLYCASCHNGNSTEVATDSGTHTFPATTIFGSPVYVGGPTLPEGSCTLCHGNTAAGNFWPDDTTGHTAPGQYKVVPNDINQAGAHVVHVLEIAKKLYGTPTPTIAQRNDTCNYCHPGNTHGSTDTNLPADVSRTDSVNDGWPPNLELGTYMKKIVGGGLDNNPTISGFWRPTPGTCSNVACHANAPYTPHWYGDTVPPGRITDLELQAGTEPGTVKLLWNAPGDDDYLDGTAYVYDVRWSTSSITDGNFASANQALAPTIRRQRNSGLIPKNQEVILKGLPSGTLYFAVKTADERYPNAAAWSTLISNVVSGTAKTDTAAPVFTGVSAVASTDFNFNIEANPDTNGVYVSWEAGRDHNHSIATPLSYQVLWSTYSLRTHFANGGPMPTTIGVDTCFDKSKTGAQLVNAACGSITPASNEYRVKSASTTALGYAVTGLPVNTVYNFLVRAKDANNIDSNRVELSAMAKPTAFKTITLKTLKTSVTIPVATTGWSGGAITASTSDAALNSSMYGTTGTFALGTNAIAFSPTTTYTAATNVWGLKFQIKITGANTATTVTYQFGYLTNKVFTPFAAQQTLTISKKMPIRLVSFPLANYKGTVPSGSKPAFIVKASQSVTMTYGADVDKGGILLFNEQPYNNLPPAATSLGQTQQPSSYIGGPLYRLTWTQPSADANGDAVHYDVFGSTDGTNFPYVIGRNLTTTTVDWDPVGDGITGSTGTARFKVIVGDGFREGAMYLNDATPLNADNDNHNETVSSTFTINNLVDVWAPAAIGSSDNGPGPADDTADDLKAETRPKQGGVSLTWKAVGNDGFNHGTRATVYDIRFSPSNIPDVETFNALPPENWAANEPFPEFTGAMERYELLGLNPETTYYFAMRVGDGTNWSGLSNVASTSAGPKCGICHATPPNETATAGNHIEHGYTMNDCANCHGNDADADDGGIFGAQFFKTDHQDGILKLGWKTKYPAAATTLVNDDIVYYQGATKIYEDLDGAGGVVQTPTAGDVIDDGTCSGFSGTNTSGCHGPAVPGWQEGVPLACSACHGDSGRTTDQNGRQFDATIDNAMVVPDAIKASPPVDNRGGSTGIYVGAHLKHLNSSFRLAKGDNCMLCHKDYVHADGNVDVNYDMSVTGTGTVPWSPATRTCSGTSVDNCHGSNTPSWDSAATVGCVSCHGFGGVTPAHVTDTAGGVSTPGTGNCTTCHPAGHPQGTLQDTSSIMIPNNPLVGIAYRSGGIHLKKVISGRNTMNDTSAIDTEAEICWGCHEDNNISEWGLDYGANNNTVDTVTLKNDYNYGTLHTTSALTTGTTRWVNDSLQGAYWKTGINNTTIQTIKKARIQSTHSTDPAGTSAVTYDATNKHYDETADSVAIIRCSNCHDVHNMSKAPGDATSGQPYLRGSWKNNPYAEDAPPILNTAYAVTATFADVPRGGTDRKYLGGYFIDQNNAQPGTPTTTANGTASEYPTTGWTTANSAGICVLCHGEDVDNLDQLADSGGLWLGTNGHSNSAIGGTFVNYANIFDNASSSLNPGGLSGRPTPVTSLTWTVQVPDMAYQAQANAATTTAYGYRGPDAGEASQYLPNNTARYAHISYNWGATVDGNTPDLMYHQFSCSKCHNPHASRLPKLLITNCLDIQHNTWDDNKSQQTNYTAAALTNVDRFAGVGERSAYYASAQNCHRYSQKRKDAGQSNPGGWNKVTPWTTAHP